MKNIAPTETDSREQGPADSEVPSALPAGLCESSDTAPAEDNGPPSLFKTKLLLDFLISVFIIKAFGINSEVLINFFEVKVLITASRLRVSSSRL